MVFALRATSGLPLDRSKGKPLTRAENLHCVPRFLPLVFATSLQKRWKYDKTLTTSSCH